MPVTPPLIRPHSGDGVLADVHVEQGVVGNVEGVAEVGAAGEQEPGVANSFGSMQPYEAVVHFGIGYGLSTLLKEYGTPPRLRAAGAAVVSVFQVSGFTATPP